MKFSDFKDIYDFYNKTGMNRFQAFEFLKKHLEGEGKHEKQQF